MICVRDGVSGALMPFFPDNVDAEIIIYHNGKFEIGYKTLKDKPDIVYIEGNVGIAVYCGKKDIIAKFSLSDDTITVGESLDMYLKYSLT